MEIRRGSFGQNSVPHIDNRLEDLLVDSVWVHARRFEFLPRFAVYLRITGVRRKFNLGYISWEFKPVNGTYQEQLAKVSWETQAERFPLLVHCRVPSCVP